MKKKKIITFIAAAGVFGVIGLPSHAVFAEEQVQPVEEMVQEETAINGAADGTILEVDETLQLTVAQVSEEAETEAVVWTSSDETLAEVSAEGVVTGKQAGDVSITATMADGESLVLSLQIQEGRAGVGGVFGTVPWTWEEATQTLVFGKGEFPATSTTVNIRTTIEASDALQGKKIKTVTFTKPVKGGKYTSYLFSSLSELEAINELSFLDMSDVLSMYSMFASASNLKTLDVSQWNTGKVTNMSSMFTSARSLTALDVSNWNTSSATNMSYMFSSANNLTALDVSKWNTSRVTTMASMFSLASSLTELDVSKWNTANVTNMSYMFSSTNNLAKLDVSNWNTSKVTTIASMFSLASSLTELDVSRWDTSNVITMSSAFYGTSSLPKLDVSKWTTSKVTNMASLFSSASALTELDLSNWDMSKMGTVSYMFNNAVSLDTLVLGEKTRLRDARLTEKHGEDYSGGWILLDGSNRYGDSHHLMSAYDGSKPGVYTREILPSAINIVSNKTELKVDETVQLTATITPEASTDKTVVWASSDGAIAEVSETGLVTGKKAGTVTITATTGNGKSHSITLTIIEKTTGMFGTVPWAWEEQSQNLIFGEGEFPSTSEFLNIRTEIEESKLLQGKKIKTITFTKPVAANRLSSYLFYSLSELEAIRELRLLDTSNVTSMYRMFKLTSNLKELDVSNWNTSKVTNMSSMFTSVKGLTQLDVSNWDTGNVTNMSYMFSSATGLTALDLGKWNTSKVTTMGSMFASASNLTDLNVGSWATENVTNMSFMFSSAGNLTTLDVSNWNTGKATNMASMFSAATGLTKLDVSKWNTSNVTNMSSMFYSAKGLTQLDVSNWDTGKVTTLSSMFSSASNLERLDVSKWNTGNVTTLSHMFRSASSLTELDVSNWNTGKVTASSHMFYSVSNLPKLDVSKWDTSNVTTMSHMFYSASSLKKLDLSNWDMSKATDLSFLFDRATSLDTLVLGKNTQLKNSRLPEKKDAAYTGKWTSLSGSSYASSQALMADYDGTKPGEYTRETKTDPTKVLGVILTPKEISLVAGASRKLYPIVYPETAVNQNVTCVSSQPLVATVSNDGRVQALSPGTAVITATTEEGGFVSSAVVIVR